jgi:DNA-binding GntR family transcriptional regulator
MLKRAQPHTIRETVTDALREAIIRGELLPGEHLKEPFIAAQMGVSRSPIREAFLQLEREGLIKSVTNQGAFVCTFTEDDINEIFMLRATLESLACQVLVNDSMLTQDDFHHLSFLINQQQAVIQTGELDRFIALDMAFHRFLCERTGMQRLLATWMSLQSQMLVLFTRRFYAYPDAVPQRATADHTLILDVLRGGDAAQASTLIHELCQYGAKALIEQYSEKEAGRKLAGKEQT